MSDYTPSKRCPRCGQILSIDKFYKSNGRYGTSSYCKDCFRDYYGSEKRLDVPGYKRCPKCKRELPLTEEYWRHAGKDKWKHRCKDCLRKPPRVKPEPSATKICKKCGTEYPNTEEYFKRSKEGYLSSPCRACIADKKREYRAAHPEETKAYRRASQKRNRASANLRSKRYRQNNREKGNIRTMQRYATVHNGLPFDFTADDWQRCLDYWQGRCAVCGRSAEDGYVIAKDHWIAVKDSRPDNPGTVPTNIVPLCHTKRGVKWGCNNKKLNQDPAKWLIAEYGEQEAAVILSRIQAYFDWLASIT